MKIIYLNTWEAKQESEFRIFLEEHVSTTDVFCFQEMYDETRLIADEYLKDFNEDHADAFAFEDNTGIEDFAQATYVRKAFTTLKSELIVDKNKPHGLGIASTVLYKGETVHVLNYHGISRPKHKLDTPERLQQSKTIVSFYKDKPGPKILGGDFNFLPETQAYKLFGTVGYRELIHDFKVETTRNHLYWDNRPQKHLFSDYIFLSKDIVVDSFTVSQLEVSDHLPMILEVSL